MLPAACITVVTGLPRSGTSLLMQMLAAGGLPPLTDALRTADESNPRGYYEDERVKRLRTDQTWLNEAQGHAIKVIHLLLPELPTDAGSTYRVLFLRRRMDRSACQSARHAGPCQPAGHTFFAGPRMPGRRFRSATGEDRCVPAQLSDDFYRA